MMLPYIEDILIILGFFDFFKNGKLLSTRLANDNMLTFIDSL